MGLVYTTLLSLIPLLAFSFAILKVFGAHHDLEPIVYEFFRPVGADSADRTHRARHAIRRPRQQRHRGLGGLCPARLDPARHDQESRGQFQLPVAGRAAAQLRPARRRISLSLLVVGPLLLVAFIGLSHATIDSAPVQEVARCRSCDAAGHGDRHRPVRHGDGVLHGHVHAHSQHPGALAARAHRRAGRRCSLGGRWQDVHGVRRAFHAAEDRLCGLCDSSSSRCCGPTSAG